jgi:hypothetical protein
MSLFLLPLLIGLFRWGRYSQGGEEILREWRKVSEKGEKKFGKWL